MNLSPFTDIFKFHFLNDECYIAVRKSPKIVPRFLINNQPVLVQIMAWYRTVHNPWSKPAMAQFDGIYVSTGQNVLNVNPKSFSSLFIRNNDIHSHNTRTADHFHIPIVTTDLSKTGIKYRGAVIWNTLIKDGINVDVSEAVFKKFLRKLVNDGIIP